MTEALYIHIPFCEAKCSYCSFNSYAGLEGLQRSYVDCLCAEMRNVASRGHMGALKTVFLGGGTPTFLSKDLLKQVLGCCFSLFPVVREGEISIEANPGTVEREKFSQLQDMGVNRLSIGVQSFHDQELRQVGRIHTAHEAIRAVEMAREAGFENLSIDLMYGLPGQNSRSWQESLETALSLGVKHLSLYQLTPEEGTPLVKMMENGLLQLPGEGELAEMDRITAELTGGAGLVQYEISNYAKEGFECKHNVNYWENREYQGVGAGAVSYLQGKRVRNEGNPYDYCALLEQGQSVGVEEEVLDRESSFRETMIMGLRMNRGVSVREMQNRYGIDPENYYRDILPKLMSGGLLELSADFLRLTEKGRVFANSVMADLV